MSQKLTLQISPTPKKDIRLQILKQIQLKLADFYQLDKKQFEGNEIMFDYQFILKQENLFLVIPQIVSKIEKEKLEKELNFFSVCVDKQYMYFLFSRDSLQPICEVKRLENSVCISANIIQQKIHGKYSKQQQIFNRIRQTSVVLQEQFKKQHICLADLEIVKCISSDRELNLNLIFKKETDKLQFLKDFGLNGNINCLFLKGVLLQKIQSKQKRTGFNIEKFKKMSNYQRVCDQLQKELIDQILNCQVQVFYDQNHKKIKVTSDYPDQIVQALKILFVHDCNNQQEDLNQQFILNNNINNNDENDMSLYNQQQITDEDNEEDGQNEQLIQNNSQDNDNTFFNQQQISDNDYYILYESQGSTQNESQYDHLEQHEITEFSTQIVEISSLIDQSQLENSSLFNID